MIGYESYLDIAPEVREALASGAPVVALESTILSHGMPYPENLAFAAEAVRDAGALDVWMQPALMKKGRPGTIFLALCRSDDRDGVLAAILKHTSTLGVRETRIRRTVLDREETVMPTPVGDIRRKTASGFGVQREKLEYDALAAIARARGVSLAEARRLSGR